MTAEKSEQKKNTPKPREDSFGVALRLVYLLSLLQQRQGRKLTVREAINALGAQGHDVSDRTVQRYMSTLADHCSGVMKDEENPPGYWYESNSKEDMLFLSRESALAVCLVQAHLRHLLPSAELRHLKPIFEHAASVLDKNPSANSYKKLLKRISIFPRGWRLVPPNFKDGRIFDDVMNALTSARRLKFVYSKPNDKTSSERIIEPIGVVERSGAYYIVGPEVGTSGDFLHNGEPKNWAMHRVQKTEILSEFGYPKHFKIDEHAHNGNLSRTYKREPQKVRLRLTAEAGAHLRDGEFKISPDQKIIKESENFLEVECTVPDTAEFRWWIMEKGAGCEVLSPKYLRDEIYQSLREALQMYEGKTLKGVG